MSALRPARILLLALAATATGWTSSPHAVADAGPSGIVETERVRLVRLPVRLEATTPGGCAAIGASQIELLEDGAAITPTHLERRRLTTAHAILLDSSREMLDVLQWAKRAAHDYIGALPPNEPALVASFDDSLILHGPLSTERARLEDDLVWIETGWTAELRDSLVQMIDYLTTRTERGILLLVTRGCDAERTDSPSRERVLDLVSRVPSLRVFVVGIGVPPACEDDEGRDPVAFLRELAWRSGGTFLQPRTPAELAPMLSAVRERLDREYYLSYHPIPFGEGPRDRPKRDSFRWRKLAVRVPGSRTCEISIAGRTRRYEGRPPQREPNAEPTDRGYLQGPLVYEAGEQVLHGEIRDLVKDSGPLFVDTEPAGRVWSKRPIRVVVPPLEHLADRRAREGDELIRLLERALGSTEPIRALGAGPDPDWKQVPFLVNGRSLLAMRETLASALAGQPDYLRWARAKVRVERLAALDELETAAGALDPDRIEAVRRWLASEEWTPEPSELGRHLGAWLGDVPAVELYHRAEGHLLATIEKALVTDGVEAAEHAVAEAERVWPLVGVWLPPPRDVRVLGLLVPAYDPFLDSIGFRRIVLPRAESFLGTWAFSAKVPLGVRLLDWMFHDAAIAGLLRESFTIEGVSYPDLFGRLGSWLSLETLDAMGGFAGWGAGRSVRLHLAETDSPSHIPHEVTAFFSTRSVDGAPRAPDRFCLVLSGHAPLTGPGRALVDALVRAKARSATPCVLGPG